MWGHRPHWSAYRSHLRSHFVTHMHCHIVRLGQPVIFSSLFPLFGQSRTQQVATCSQLQSCSSAHVCVGQMAQLFVSKSLSIWGTCVDKSGNRTLTEKHTTPVFLCRTKKYTDSKWDTWEIKTKSRDTTAARQHTICPTAPLSTTSV